MDLLRPSLHYLSFAQTPDQDGGPDAGGQGGRGHHRADRVRGLQRGEGGATTRCLCSPKVVVPIVAMRGGKDRQMYLDLLLPNQAKLALVQVTSIALTFI